MCSNNVTATPTTSSSNDHHYYSIPTVDSVIAYQRHLRKLQNDNPNRTASTSVQLRTQQQLQQSLHYNTGPLILLSSIILCTNTIILFGFYKYYNNKSLGQLYSIAISMAVTSIPTMINRRNDTLVRTRVSALTITIWSIKMIHTIMKIQSSSVSFSEVQNLQPDDGTIIPSFVSSLVSSLFSNTDSNDNAMMIVGIVLSFIRIVFYCTIVTMICISVHGIGLTSYHPGYDMYHQIGFIVCIVACTYDTIVSDVLFFSSTCIINYPSLVSLLSIDDDDDEDRTYNNNDTNTTTIVTTTGEDTQPTNKRYSGWTVFVYKYRRPMIAIVCGIVLLVAGITSLYYVGGDSFGGDDDAITWYIQRQRPGSTATSSTTTTSRIRTTYHEQHHPARSDTTTTTTASSSSSSSSTTSSSAASAERRTESIEANNNKNNNDPLLVVENASSTNRMIQSDETTKKSDIAVDGVPDEVILPITELSVDGLSTSSEEVDDDDDDVDNNTDAGSVEMAGNINNDDHDELVESMTMKGDHTEYRPQQPENVGGVVVDETIRTSIINDSLPTTDDDVTMNHDSNVVTIDEQHDDDDEMMMVADVLPKQQDIVELETTTNESEPKTNDNSGNLLNNVPEEVHEIKILLDNVDNDANSTKVVQEQQEDSHTKLSVPDLNVLKKVGDDDEEIKAGVKNDNISSSDGLPAALKDNNSNDTVDRVDVNNAVAVEQDEKKLQQSEKQAVNNNDTVDRSDVNDAASVEHTDDKNSIKEEQEQEDNENELLSKLALRIQSEVTSAARKTITDPRASEENVEIVKLWGIDPRKIK